uniref:non-specific serine/threonine protein kinase n=1 Tax=Setaria viridis TaxID=4556 RepID=A0A4U6WNQ1_SETVI|nr:hypothetical protein SEVIR_1G236700v2 [Setaria viridis]
MFENNLSGGIPQTLSNLSSLRQLSLEGNTLGNTLPSNFGNALPSLQILYLGNDMLVSGLIDWDLSSNKFTGQIPSIFGSLSGLSILNLEENMLEASDSAGWEFFDALTNCRIVPPSIGKFRALVRLSLGINNLTGTIDWIGKLQKLHKLNLNNNNFIGAIPPSLSNLTQLTTMSFAENKFTDFIPPGLGNLKHMTSLNLSYNNFQGSIPVKFGNLKQLMSLHVSSNKLSGVIPETLGQRQQLTTIQMDENILTGNIRTTFSNLNSLSTLNVLHNNLSGPMPACLNDLELLTKLDLSYNNFEGEIPRNGVFDNASVVSLDGNPRLCGGATDFHVPSCHLDSRSVGLANNLVEILIPIFVFMSLIVSIYIIIYGNKTSRRPYLLLLSFGKRFPKKTSSKSNLIGSGSYGAVYKGKLTQAKIEVAIKVFDLEMRCAEKSFISECEMLRSIRHRNLLPILTACSTIDNTGNDFKALIYVVMQNGNLDTWLHPRPTAGLKHLDLIQRVNIAVSIADALAYLHHDCGNPIVHCDLKPTNILLDDDMDAHLGDFGIASIVLDSRSAPVGHSGLNSSVVATGTIGYIAPEYGQCVHASTCGDVYSKRPTDSMFEGKVSFASFVERNFPNQMLDKIDAYLQEECKRSIQAMPEAEKEIYQCLLSLVQVALSCTRLCPRERMRMREIWFVNLLSNKMQLVEKELIIR